MKKTFSSLIIVSILSLSSCGIFNKKSAPAINQTSWTLIKIDDFQIEALKKEITIHFENGKINGYSGCNSYSANVKQKENNIQFTEILGTLKACEPGSATESKYLSVLKSANKIQVKNGKLQLKSGNRILAEFEQNKKK